MTNSSTHSYEYHGALSAPAAAKYLDTTVGTLAKWRYLGEGPPYVKLGRRVVYRRETLERYLRSLEVATTGVR